MKASTQSSCPTCLTNCKRCSWYFCITSPSTQRATEVRPFPIEKAACFPGFPGGASWNTPGRSTQLHHLRNCALEQVCKVGVCHLPPRAVRRIRGDNARKVPEPQQKAATKFPSLSCRRPEKSGQRRTEVLLKSQSLVWACSHSLSSK